MNAPFPQPNSTDDAALALAAQIVIDGLATIFTSWMHEYPDLIDSGPQDELASRIDTWTKQRIIDGYTRGEITEEQTAALIREHGLIHA